MAVRVGATQRLSLEQLPLQRDDVEPKTLRVQTTRYHGQIAAFLAEVRGRVAAGEQVLIAAASAGELERLADLCREYEVPYRLGEIEQSATGARLAEDATSGSAPGGRAGSRAAAGRFRHSRRAPGVLRHRRSVRERCRLAARAAPAAEDRELLSAISPS